MLAVCSFTTDLRHFKIVPRPHFISPLKHTSKTYENYCDVATVVEQISDIKVFE